MDEQLPGVTPTGGDTPQEDNAASETEALEAEEVSQDAPRTPDAGGDGEQEEADDVTDRGTRPAKEPESRYYQQVKNENADMRALLNNPQALKAYLQDIEGTKAPTGSEEEDELKKIVDQSTMENGQVDAYKLTKLMEQRLDVKVQQGMQHLSQDMNRAQSLQRRYDQDKTAVRSDHPELDPRKKEYDAELEAFVGERYIAQGGLEGKVSLQEVVDSTFAYMEKVRGSATKRAETEIVRKQVGSVRQATVPGNTENGEANMTAEQILAQRVRNQLKGRS